ncbi:hypothetical protein G7B40_040550 [Aetokthonos hydrillicola Thurmond2011]|jgi:hypothetical protein|uniref:Uncharacterized protein n=1 Tax=Aetokthonos hydrillicola Thurmond2011 TaxID=2712845 RepID=A0AAP5IIP5_9CYAN|nr:hypothetical protein [Aetokthonos hydrillicola]MBO3461020.1 hypothetical protein [Aetokthonos hydrillicola CCALA 1050]MBW4588411.1 hypothetical protein [Aetokthonos hydrillicola CCALA 1050]MDR9900780.1 hypothetical protein [Aetokthonos hydrillicola Thurmond2011]
MPYKLVQTSPGNVNVTSNLESFWFFYNFNVDQGTKKVQIERGYFAAYISQKSGKPFIQSLYGDSNEKKEDLYRKLEISNVAEQKISINNARLVDSRFSQFSNEVSQLHLFDFSDENEHKKEWIDTKGWSPKFTNPTKNDDGKYFLKQTLSFGQVKDRYTYWLSTQATAKGTERFALAVPFIASSLMGTILALHQQDLPKIQISVDEKSWPYPSGQELPGAIKGFMMVAEGAFKAIALNGEVDNLIQQVTSDKPSKDILAYLSQIIHRYPTPISRTINTAPVTSSNSVVPSSPELPIEVLYMEGLNSTNHVEMIIK